MESKGRLFLAGLLCAFVGMTAQALATSAGDVGHGMTPEQAKDVSTQNAVVTSISNNTKGAVSVTTVKVLLTQSSGGEALPEFVNIIETGSSTGANAQTKKLAENFTKFFDANSGKPNSLTMSSGEVENVLNVISGVAPTAAVNVAQSTVEAIGGFGGSIQSHMGSLQDMAQAGDSSVSSFGANASLGVHNNMIGYAKNRIWASPFYVHQNMGDKDGYTGYKYQAGGMSLGYDRALGSNIVVGAAFTFSHGDYERKRANDDNTIKTYGVSGYAQFYGLGGFFANIAGGYSYGDNKWSESIMGQTQAGKNHTNSYWVGSALGYNIRANSNLVVTPSIGLFWSESRSSAYKQTGPFASTVGKMSSKSLVLPVDLTVQYKHEINDCSSVTFKVGGGYSYNFKNDGARGSITYDYIGGTPIAVSGMAPGRHSWNATTGIKYQYKNVDVGVDYRYDGKKKFDAHRVSATVGLNF